MEIWNPELEVTKIILKKVYRFSQLSSDKLGFLSDFTFYGVEKQFYQKLQYIYP
jgi:hypothetical protein